MSHNRDTKIEKNKYGVEFKINHYPEQTSILSWFCFFGKKHERFESESSARIFAENLKGE